MKQKRAKAYRKQMHVYISTFKFKTPIQCLVDAEMILHAEKTKFDVIKGITRTIQTEPKLMITQCCINQLYETKNQPAIEIAKLMEKRRCGHKDTLSARECIESIVNISGHNKHRYLVVTQDEKLRRNLRRVPGVPLIYMNRSVMIMEPLSPASARIVEQVESSKLTGGLNDPKFAGMVKPEEEEPKEAEEPPKKKRKGPKGPNPLSAKKKKVVKDEKKDDKKEGDDESESKKRRRRKHKKSGEQAGEQDGDQDEDQEEQASVQVDEE